MSEINSSLTGLECTACGAKFSADVLHNVCPACGKILFATYDLEPVRENLPKEAFPSGRELCGDIATSCLRLGMW